MNENSYKPERVQIISQKEILSFSEALIYLEISKSLLYKLTSRRGIPFSKPNGGKIYFKKEDLDNWMLRNKQFSIEERENEVNINIKSGSHENC